MTATLVLLHAATYPLTRYRLPLDVLWMVVLGVELSRWSREVRSRSTYEPARPATPS